MDALGLQTILSLYDTTGNTEICSFSGSTPTLSLSSNGSGTELKRLQTKSTITLIGKLLFTADSNFFIEYETTNIPVSPCTGPNIAIMSIDLKSGSDVCARLSIYVDDNAIILKGLKTNDIGYTARYGGLFLVFH